MVIGFGAHAENPMVAANSRDTVRIDGALEPVLRLFAFRFILMFWF
jgi:hypothetical protein